MDIRPIKTDEDHEQALRRIEELWNVKVNTPEGDELEVLTTLVEAYEVKHHQILPPDPIEAIKFRMEQLEMKKTDLAHFRQQEQSIRGFKQKKETDYENDTGS